MKGDQKRNLSYKVEHVCSSLFVCNFDMFGKIFESNHELVDLVGF